jgi:DNA-binding response OmpR family regulator
MDERHTTNQRVLLVEDEIRLGESIQRGIARHGHEVALVRDCASAISAGLHAVYDVLVLDINLPDAAGWQVLAALDAARRRSFSPSPELDIACPTTLRARSKTYQ